ncbi:peptidyl-prolyl cis-trans isomerase FKBP11-like [Petromyzon marinus]|uniref:peptidyl-prolyl cis-trans isomerase FKBP11-like n=1 Tax=Petromyzon marinus TaxID=7757 RepID=UPI003F6F4C3E
MLLLLLPSRALLGSLLLLGLLGLVAGTDPAELLVEVVHKPAECVELSAQGDTLHVHYTGRLKDGSVFDTSAMRDPLQVELGKKQVIPGWEQGLLGMCVGEKRKLVIPPHLAYGKRGAPPSIPADAVLTFETELVSLRQKETWERALETALPFVYVGLVPGLLCLLAYYLYRKASAPRASRKKAKEERKNKKK